MKEQTPVSQIYKFILILMFVLTLCSCCKIKKDTSVKVPKLYKLELELEMINEKDLNKYGLDRNYNHIVYDNVISAE